MSLRSKLQELVVGCAQDIYGDTWVYTAINSTITVGVGEAMQYDPHGGEVIWRLGIGFIALGAAMGASRTVFRRDLLRTVEPAAEETSHSNDEIPSSETQA